jgi:hypothetical protein
MTLGRSEVRFTPSLFLSSRLPGQPGGHLLQLPRSTIRSAGNTGTMDSLLQKNIWDAAVGKQNRM